MIKAVSNRDICLNKTLLLLCEHRHFSLNLVPHGSTCPPSQNTIRVKSEAHLQIGLSFIHSFTQSGMKTFFIWSLNYLITFYRSFVEYKTFFIYILFFIFTFFYLLSSSYIKVLLLFSSITFVSVRFSFCLSFWSDFQFFLSF